MAGLSAHAIIFILSSARKIKYLSLGKRTLRQLTLLTITACSAACGSSSMPGPISGSSASGASDGSAPAPTIPAPTYNKTLQQEVSIAMDDGVHLAATVTFPSLDGSGPAPGKFPVVLSITPYGRNGVCGCDNRPLQAQLIPPLFATHGIIEAVVDTRGTGGSEGDLNGNYFSPREQKDGYALIEYFGTQPYSSGKVGMTGDSYVGITQLLAAEQQPPHLAAIAPSVALSDLYRDAWAHGGIPNLFFDAQYTAVQGAPGLSGVNTAPALLAQTVTGKFTQLTGTPTLFDYLERPNDGPFYRDRSPIYRDSLIKVPVLVLGSWRDGLSQRGGPENYYALAQRPGVETRLNMNPCTHKGCGAPDAPTINPPGQDNQAAVVYEFLSKYLLGTPTPNRANVRFYVQGTNRILEADQWPPKQTHFIRLYLGQGKLSAVSPANSGSENYFTNPADGLSMTFDEYGTVAATPYIPTDQRAEDGRGLTFRTDALKENLLLAGPISLHLVAASTANDTDWIAKVADVGTDGSETLITNGYLRASHRELDPSRSREGVPYHTHVNPTPVESGKVYAYEIEIWPTAYELTPGHKLQVRLTSYDVPTHAPAYIQFDRNNPAAAQLVPMLPATNAVSEGSNDPSFLLIPVFGG